MFQTTFDLYKFLILLGVATTSLVVSALATPRLRDFARQRGLFDMPEKRRIHKIPTPRIGGVGMCLGFTLAVLGGLLAGLLVPGFWHWQDLWRICLLLLGSVIITTVMLVDDVRGLAPLPKLAWQGLVAAIVIGPQLFVVGQQPVGVLIEKIAGQPQYTNIAEQPVWLLFFVPFTFFWIVGMMNTVNWTDGLDGLAGGVVCIGAIILFLETLFSALILRKEYQFTSSLLALALAASVVGFLIFNWHPASIFMGDSGAMFLGYALAVISIIDGAKVATALLIIGFPVLDVFFVIINRIRRGKSPLKADRSHIHQSLLDKGWGVRRIVILFYSLSFIFGIIGVLPFMQVQLYKFISLIALVICLLPLLLYSLLYRPKANQPTLEEVLDPSEQVNSSN